ncbi:hypothetical protein V6N11_035231 [Hibiscus sabdariffa]|uniref:Uncharacterized protein n=1 Tax=Hibiscus sabdariffa TaxID=183260 RepID=A0ABR2R0C5_9ROSI
MGRKGISNVLTECKAQSKAWVSDNIANNRDSLMEFEQKLHELEIDIYKGNAYQGDMPLATLFPRIYALAVQKKGKVNEFGCKDDGGWS